MILKYKSLDHWRESGGPICATVQWGGEDIVIACGDWIPVAEMAELAALEFCLDRRIFATTVTVKVHWADGATFGPFKVELSLRANALGLRGGE